MEFAHRSVLLNECIDALAIKPDGIYIDGTLGRAGHSREIARRLTTGRLVCIDRDQAAIDAAARLQRYEKRYAKATAQKIRCRSFPLRVSVAHRRLPYFMIQKPNGFRQNIFKAVGAAHERLLN